MAVGEYDDDEFVVGRPPVPDDRPWRHPSEVAAAQRAAHRRAERRVWRIGFLSALTGALVVGAFWYLSDTGTDIQVVTQRVSSVPVESVAPRVTPADEWATEVAAGSRSATAIVASVDGTRSLAGAVAVHDDGYLLTSARAVGDATDVIVHTDDGHTMTAVVLGHDAETDLAVLKTDGAVDPATVAGAPAERGDVVAVVDPGGSAHRRLVTDAVASSTAVDGDRLIGLLGLDGDRGDLPAGSPVLDATGAVIGILSATEPGAAVTVVPIDVANAVAEAIISDGEAHRAWLGVSARMDHENDGVLVTAVTPDSPAAVAGVLVDDHIVAIDDRDVTSPAAVVAALRVHEPGEPVVITVRRADETLVLETVLGEDAD